MKQDLASLIARVKDRPLARDFLSDILTPQEREEIELRLKLVKMLLSGVPQRSIAEKLGVSLCKITRGSREIQYGKGSFKKLLT